MTPSTLTTALPPRNAPAVTALALGVTGLILAPLLIGSLLGLLALILGTVALRRRGRRGMAAGGMVTGALAILVALITAVLFVVLPRAAQRAREATATANLRQLSRALASYAVVWNGQTPDRLAGLVPYLGGNLGRVLRDPRAGGGPRRGGRLAPGDPAALETLEQNADFYYADPSTLREGALIVFYDKSVPGTRRLVAFADGHVESFVPGSPELRAAVQRNNEARERLNLRLLPLDLEGLPPAATRPSPE